MPKKEMIEDLISCSNLFLNKMQEHSSLLINALDKDLNRCEDAFGSSKEKCTGKCFDELFPQFKMINA